MSDGRRREFAALVAHAGQVPDPQSPATFERSRLNWEERCQAPHSDRLEWHQQLIRLRRGLPDPVSGFEATRVSCDDAARWPVMRRGAIQVVCNLASSGQRVPLEPCAMANLMASDQRARLIGNWLELPAESGAIIGPP